MAKYRARRREPPDPWTKEPRDPIELMGRMVGETTYRDGGGTSGGGLQTCDIAASVGLIEDREAANLAMMVGGRIESMLPATVKQMYRRVLQDIDLRKAGISRARPADRWRLRVVLYDATEDMLTPEHRRSLRAAAKAAKMRQDDYARLYQSVSSALHSIMGGARKEFRLRLWAEELLARTPRPREEATACSLLMVRTDYDPPRACQWWSAPTLNALRESIQERDWTLAPGQGKALMRMLSRFEALPQRRTTILGDISETVSALLVRWA